MSFLKDLRYGARKLVRNPVFSLISIVTLAVGIGLTATMFSIVYGALMRGLPFEGGDRIMHLERNNLPADIQSMEVSLHDFADWRAQQRSFAGLAAFTTGTVNVAGAEKPERYDGAFITANGFQVLGARPHLGRTFREGEDQPGGPRVVVLGYELWRQRYDGDPGIVGKTIRVNGEESEVIGVMPEGFLFPISQEIWVPMREVAPAKRGEGPTVEVYGRLRPGVSRAQARTEMSSIARRLALTYPEANQDVGAVVQPYTDEYVGNEAKGMLFAMLAAVFLVLLIACSNVANLLLSQAAMRGKEVGVRTALGASRRQIVMQFLTEPLALAAAGALLGVGVAWLGVRMFNNAIASTDPPFWIDIRIDGPVLLFVLAITIFATLVSGVLPALRVSSGNVNEALKDESRGSSSMRGGVLSRVLVVMEVALSVALLVSAGLTIKTVTRLKSMDFGVPTDVFTARVGLPESDYPDSASQVRFFEQLHQRLPELQGAEAVALGSGMPGGIQVGGEQIAIEGKQYQNDRDYPDARSASITPGYFATFRVGVDGRDFSAQDRAGSVPVAIVNASFARTHFGAQGAVGRRFRPGGAESTAPWLTIVGTVPDLYMDGPDNEEPEAFYTPFSQTPQRFMSVIARPRGEWGALTTPVRELVASIDPDLPIYFVSSLRGRIDEETWFYRVFGTIFIIFGFVALFLSAIGLYGVMAFNVSRRTREMGVRMALGASARHVVRLVLRQGLVQIAIGVVIGLFLALGLAWGLRIILLGEKWFDPPVFVVTVLVLVASGVAACMIPARRATRVDPMVALRYE
ncbi:MAG TPA: ABC transporter permease [Longimicrobiaceae bacterium]|nr:ABC transporter permease [Longimicrobiaceae bacterium]